jgi:hypothetical protein
VGYGEVDMETVIDVSELFWPLCSGSIEPNENTICIARLTIHFNDLGCIDFESRVAILSEIFAMFYQSAPLFLPE